MAIVVERNIKCWNFFEKLEKALANSHLRLPSCNNDFSNYLCPIGTFEEVTYESKPELSFRVSDHWNWYANTKKCPNPNYIQCFSSDLPWAHKRNGQGLPSKPIIASCVALFKDGKYHVVYGERYNRKTHEWSWIDNTVEEVLKML